MVKQTLLPQPNGGPEAMYFKGYISGFDVSSVKINPEESNT